MITALEDTKTYLESLIPKIRKALDEFSKKVRIIANSCHRRKAKNRPPGGNSPQSADPTRCNCSAGLASITTAFHPKQRRVLLLTTTVYSYAACLIFFIHFWSWSLHRNHLSSAQKNFLFYSIPYKTLSHRYDSPPVACELHRLKMMDFLLNKIYGRRRKEFYES